MITLTFSKTPDGLFADLIGDFGHMQATIHRPDCHRRLWRLCYATCSGNVAAKQGKVEDFGSLKLLKEVLSNHARALESDKHAD